MSCSTTFFPIVLASIFLVWLYTAAMPWEIEVVEVGKVFSWMTDRSLRLDAGGNPHIAYGEEHLYYAYHDGVTWHYEVADLSPGVGEYASLALDGSSFPHISYRIEYPIADLRYAYRDETGWRFETVDAAGMMGSWTSLALDASGTPHISYYDEMNADLKYAYRDSSGWHTEIVDAEGVVGRYTSLALDGSGYPHISYYGNGDLKYAYSLGPQAIVLTGTLRDEELVLSWTIVGGVAAYWVYGAENLSWFLPGMGPGYEHRMAIVVPPTTSWSSSNGISDQLNNWTYLVMEVNGAEQEIARSNRVGEWDCGIDIP